MSGQRDGVVDDQDAKDDNTRALAARFVDILRRGECPWCKHGEGDTCYPECPAEIFVRASRRAP